MITTLHIKNIGIIEEVCVDFQQGFNVITGETGAGKTLIMDALGIIAGGRFSKEMIRKGEEHSFVEVNLYEPENKEAIDGTIIVSREIYANGRNCCKINGRLVTVSELKSFMQNRMDIHGQHDNQILMNPAKHMTYVDEMIGNDMKQLKKEYQEQLSRYQKVQIEMKKNYGDEKEKQRKLDLLRYQYREIEQANLKLQEEEELEEKRKLMMHAEKIAESLNETEQQLSESVIEGLGIAIRSLEKVERLDEHYQTNLSQLKTMYYDVQEMTRDIVDLKEQVDFDEGERNEVEQRLDLIFSLKRKYGNTIQEILNYQKQLQEEIITIENLEEYVIALKEDLKQVKEKLRILSKKMHDLRVVCATTLEKKVNRELQELEMKQARFKVEMVWNEKEEYTTNGLDQVQFLIATNAGEELKSLDKIASGGEISRIMLAIKTVLSDIDAVETMVFDEIDTGISGVAAKAVSQKMKNIAKKHQIFVVTHLAVIAASANYHFFLSKETKKDRTKTRIKQLNEEESIQEIARMATGNITNTALEHAKELKLCG